MTSTSSSTSHLDSILGTLAVPSEYGYYDKITEEAIVDRLKQWKNAVTEHLTELRDWIKQRGSELSVDDQAAVVYTTACFYGELSWGSPDSGKLVEGVSDLVLIIFLCSSPNSEILMQFSDPSTQLLQTILRERIKPIFQANPHPHLNASTGRKLPEGVGGHLAYQDYYDGQVWKGHPGAANVMLWCVQHIQVCFSFSAFLLQLIFGWPDRDVREFMASHHSASNDPPRRLRSVL